MLYSGEVIRKFKRAAADYSMFSGVSGILAGYSGGADSSALLNLLREYCAEQGIYLKALHVNHGIRGDEAERDTEHCRKTSESLGIDFIEIRADIPALAKESGRGIEETARNFRYEAFARILAEDERLGCVSTAHNSDDNAETIIFNLVRGTGVDGLSGIPPVREIAGGRVIRPLIYCSKEEILGYCRENGIEYIFDSTNDDTAYSRNYIRREIMPKLARLNPAYLGAIGRLGKSARADAGFLAETAEKFVSENEKDGSVEARILSEAAEPIASRAIMYLYRRVSGIPLETVHISALLNLVRKADENSSLSLPGGVTARISRGRLGFAKTPDETDEDFYCELKPGINRFENPDFAVLVVPGGRKADDFEKDNEYLKNIYKLSIHTLLKSDKIKHILFIRPKRDGDAYVYGRMTRKLKKLFNDRKIALNRRKTLPLFCDAEGIVWVPGFGTADRVNDAVNDKINETSGIEPQDFVGIYYYYNE